MSQSINKKLAPSIYYRLLGGDTLTEVFADADEAKERYKDIQSMLRNQSSNVTCEIHQADDDPFDRTTVRMDAILIVRLKI